MKPIYFLMFLFKAILMPVSKPIENSHSRGKCFVLLIYGTKIWNFEEMIQFQLARHLTSRTKVNESYLKEFRIVMS